MHFPATPPVDQGAIAMRNADARRVIKEMAQKLLKSEQELDSCEAVFETYKRNTPSLAIKSAAVGALSSVTILSAAGFVLFLAAGATALAVTAIAVALVGSTILCWQFGLVDCNRLQLLRYQA